MFVLRYAFTVIVLYATSYQSSSIEKLALHYISVEHFIMVNNINITVNLI